MFGSFFSPGNGLAADMSVADIVESVRPMDAVVIASPDGGLLLNKGSLNGIRRGELWSIHQKGEIVKDPVSGEELGRFDKILGIVKVVRTDERFCQIERVKPTNLSLKTGQQAIRFDGINSIFQDGSGIHYQLYENLRADLPNLSWQDYQMVSQSDPAETSSDALLFSVSADRIAVWSGGEILKIYGNIRSESSPAKTGAAVLMDPQPVEKQEPMPIPSIEPERPALQKKPGMMTPGLSAKITSREYRSVGSLDGIVYHLDVMVDKNENAYFVYLTDSGLFAKDALNPTQVITYRYEGFGQVAGISVGPDGMVAMNIFNQREWAMVSLLLKLFDDHFEVVVRDINYILAYADINNDGIAELIGQRFDREIFFGSGVFELNLQGTRLNRVGAIEVPVGFRIFGSFWADFDNDHVIENGFFNLGRQLLIYTKGKETWRSTNPFGGSIQGVMIENIDSENATSRREIVWSPAAVVPYKSGKFVALAYNDASLLNAIGMRPSKGEVGILYKHNGQYFLRLLDAGFEGPVQSVFAWQDELYCAVVEGGIFSGKGGKTHMIAFPIEELKKAIE